MSNATDPVARHEDYSGARKFDVTAPGHKTILVAAPDEACAIAAAGKYWKARWQQWEFYSGCIVCRRS